MSFNLTLNKEYTKEEIESIFDTHFGYGMKGNNLRKYKDGKPYIILFSKQFGPYTDEFSKNIFSYDGEGTNKDQILHLQIKLLLMLKKIEEAYTGLDKKVKKDCGNILECSKWSIGSMFLKTDLILTF